MKKQKVGRIKGKEVAFLNGDVMKEKQMETDIKKRVLAALEQEQELQVQFLQSIIREPSLLGKEKGVQTLMEGMFREMGLDVHVFEPDEKRLQQLRGHGISSVPYSGRPNVVGIWPSRAKGGRSLVLNGHVDVVSPGPLHQWSQDPWGGFRDGNRLFGRGSMDMKGGVAAYVFAARGLQKAGVKLRGDLILQSVIEEECTGNGTLACLDRGFVGDGALVPEPSPVASIAQLGVIWGKVTVQGVAGHVLQASQSINAIEKIYPIIQALRELEKKANQNKHPAWAQHEWPINFNPGIIRGGDWASTVPSECTLEFRFGFFPDESVADAQKRVRQCIEDAAQRDPWLKNNPPSLVFEGFHAEGCLTSGSENPVIQVLGEAHQEMMGEPLKLRSMTATTDARYFLNNYNIPCTCYGPRGAGIHARDEYVEISSLWEVTRVIALFAMRWCGHEAS